MARRLAGKLNTMDPSAKPMARAGFTLVELLVVMAIVTILVGITIPVILQSRNRARAAACVSNLRQLSDAVQAYGHDWDDRYPCLSSSSFAGGFSTDRWPDGCSATELQIAISRYLNNGRVYECSNDSGAREYGFKGPRETVFSRAGSSYLPWSTARPGLYGIAFSGTRSSFHTPASSYCILRDYGSDWHGYRVRSGLDVVVQAVANAAFADGHVAAMPILSVGISGRRYQCCGMSQGNAVYVSGGSDDVQVDLSGHGRLVDDVSAQPKLQLSLSGSISSAGVENHVDHIFTFAAGTKTDAALRQVAAWADGRAAR